VEIGMEGLHPMPFNACKFHENWRGKNRNLFGAVNEFFFFFTFFYRIWVILRTEDVQDNLLGVW